MPHTSRQPARPRPSRRAAWAAALCSAAALLAACNTQKADNRPPEEIISERAAARWQAMMDREYAKAYEHVAPSVRSVMSLDGYKRRYNILSDQHPSSWKKAEVRGVSCESSDACTAKVYLETQIHVPKFQGMRATAETEERWILQDGQWWVHLR